ncbi:RidA family protein [Achromobacter sp. NPDC058515]|uniref:RidA family protein n=1 Tax=Achromobacter sp. NPDC058515 TaxID=3346533 RepID=UPI003654F2F4
MPKMIHTPRDKACGGHYSHAVRAGDYVFVSGQTPRDGVRAVVGKTIEEQTTVTLENVRLTLEAAGGALENVVKVGVFLSDLADAAGFDQIYASHFPTFRPARTTVGCALNGVLVEIDAVAYIPVSARGQEVTV